MTFFLNTATNCIAAISRTVIKPDRSKSESKPRSSEIFALSVSLKYNSDYHDKLPGTH